MITRETKTLTGSSGAIFSDCGKYRYSLWRVWDDTLPRALFCLTNPSKADHEDNDPTVERQTRRVSFWPEMGLPRIGGIGIVNPFAYIETYSDRLPKLHQAGVDLIGAENDEVILKAAKEAAIVICGWGTPGLLGGRGARVLKIMIAAGVTPHAFKINRDGTPQHPLYLSYKLKPFPMEDIWQ